MNQSSAQESYRIVAVEDGFFRLEWKRERSKRETFISIVLWEGVDPIDVKLERVTVDGMDATPAFMRAMGRLKCGALDAILMGGATFAGFNIIDPNSVYESLKVPVIVVTRSRPDDVKVREALEKHFTDWKDRWRILEEFRRKSKVYQLSVGGGSLYIQPLGIRADEAKRLIKSLTRKSAVPEPLRLAKIIASAVSRAVIELLEDTRE